MEVGLMAAGVLSGYSLSISVLGVDHTYVESSLGHVWPCWGRSTAGTLVCSGTGNVDQADCLSTPASQAGITYAISGVCHQTANRILWPAGINVNSAKGARGSVFAWGSYGRDPGTLVAYSPSSYPWPEVGACLSAHAHP